MATLSDILTAEQGTYECGVRDCLTTALAVANYMAPNPPLKKYAKRIAAYHKLPENEAWIKAVKAGGPLQLHVAGLGNRATVVDSPLPGDLVFYESYLMTSNSCSFKAKRGHELIAFVDSGYAILHWTPTGLSPVINRPEVAAILRVR